MSVRETLLFVSIQMSSELWENVIKHETWIKQKANQLLAERRNRWKVSQLRVVLLCICVIVGFHTFRRSQTEKNDHRTDSACCLSVKTTCKTFPTRVITLLESFQAPLSELDAEAEVSDTSSESWTFSWSRQMLRPW